MAQAEEQGKLSRRKFLAVTGAAALAAACAPTTGTGGPSASGAGATSTAAAKTLKIGQLLPFSSVYTELGNSMKRATDLYLKTAGNKIAGRPVTVIYEDEANDTGVGQQKTRKFIDQDQVDVMLGVVATPISYAIRDIVDGNQMIFICTNAGGDSLTREKTSDKQPASKSPYIFRASFSSWQISEPMGEYLASKKGIKEAQLSYANYGFGTESAADFRQGFTKQGGAVKGTDVKPPLGNADFVPFVTQMAANPTKATYSFYSGSDAVKFLQTWASLGMKDKGYQLFGAGFMTEQDVLRDAAAAKAAVGAITSLHWAVTLDNPENKTFVDAYQKEYSLLPDVFAMQAWDGMHAVDEAVKALKGDTSDKQKFIRALEDVKFNGPRGPFEFDKTTHNVIQDIYIREVREQGGQVVNVIVDKVGRVTDPGK